MKPIKKVEIIIGQKESEKVLRLLQKSGITGYSLIKNVQGMGEKFERDGDYPSDVFSNYYIVIGCDSKQFENIKEPLREILIDNSGVCLVSDAEWLIH